MPTSPSREEIEEVLAGVDGDNEARRRAVEAFLDGDTRFNLDRVDQLQGMTLREMILDDLHSYPSWEKS